jgi:hypothetical protein
VLLVVIDNEKPQEQQTAENAASDLSYRIKVPMRTGDCRN